MIPRLRSLTAARRPLLAPGRMHSELQRSFSNAPAADEPYARLEDHFLRVQGQGWFQDLEVDTSPGSRPVIAISGDQLTGKTTLRTELLRRFQGVGLTAGRVFRARAAELGITVAELSRRAVSDPSIDIQIEYCMVRNMASGRLLGASDDPAALSGAQEHQVLVGEGRMCGVMANYLRRVHGRQNIWSVYVLANPRAQTLRWLRREVSEEKSREAGLRIPEEDFQSLEEVLPYIQAWDTGIAAAYRDNIDRDDSDRKRYRWFYGDSELLDYRNTAMYDVVVDTSQLEINGVVDAVVEGLLELPTFHLKPVV